MKEKVYSMNSTTKGNICCGSYRDELRTREPKSVDERLPGGAFGCPGDYFRGATAMACRAPFWIRCDRCWSQDYREEEWIPYESRYE